MDSTQKMFEAAVNIVRNMPKDGPFKPSDELKLKFYALFKQASHGPNDTPRPRFYDVVSIYKWNAWKKLDDMSKEEAKSAYINELKQIIQSMALDEESTSQFNHILGPFYEYCKGSSSSATQSSIAIKQQQHTRGLDESPATNSATAREPSSSGDSSDSSDGDKNPNNIYCTVAQQISDQMALAVLRLQYSMEHTIQRIDSMEARLASVEKLQNSVVRATRSKANPILDRASTAFYLTWPILVYLMFRAWEQRQQTNRMR